MMKCSQCHCKEATPSTNFTADLEATYPLPLHIALTDLYPDIVWWDDSHKQLWLAELTVCFETSFEEARERKEAKYSDPPKTICIPCV